MFPDWSHKATLQMIPSEYVGEAGAAIPDPRSDLVVAHDRSEPVNSDYEAEINHAELIERSVITERARAIQCCLAPKRGK